MRNRFRQWALTKHSHCYLCGEQLDFINQESSTAYSADHIWPRSYGGDSTEENLLPACRKCNNEHKANFASWAMTSVQSVVLGIDPQSHSLQGLPGTSRFALHHRKVQQIAICNKITFKEAYQRAGPSKDIRVINNKIVSHFFNLANHDSIHDD